MRALFFYYILTNTGIVLYTIGISLNKNSKEANIQ
ncbi:MAG: hypothetical protein K0R55_3976, partial [Sporomusa sp.]|nr:hypothetical protein [Sporomusa sp.]